MTDKFEFEDGIEDEFGEDKKRSIPIINNSISFSQSVFIKFKIKYQYRKNKIKIRKKCQCDQGNSTCSMSWKILSSYFKGRYNELNQEYCKLIEDTTIEEANVQTMKKLFFQTRQIQKDLNRTHPKIKQFSKDSKGVEELERVLQCVSKYDPRIGYVQGMNYLIAGLLYHSEEYVAFWNFVVAYDNLELRDIYLPSKFFFQSSLIDLPGLRKHQHLVELLLQKYEEKLYNHLIDNSVQFFIICTPLFLSLFGMVIPLEDYLQFYYRLIRHGWVYAYKVILVYFRNKKDFLLNCDGCDLLIFLTSANHQMQDENEQNQFFEDWRRSLFEADKIQIDEQLVKTKLDQWDGETQTFLKK